MKILLIGPQGSGKSTQAKLLADYPGMPHISTGDIFREAITSGSELGQRVQKILAEGKLVDDETTCEVVKERLSQTDCVNGFILDGYPRNLNQRQLFDPRFDKVVYLKVSDDELMKRLMARSRADDTADAIKTRLDLYHQQTKPLLEYYQGQSILIGINGLGSINEIQGRIREVVNDRN